MKEKRDRLKRRNAATQDQNDIKAATQGPNDDRVEYVSDDELRQMGILNMSSRRITKQEIENLKRFEVMPKRQIFYDGGGSDFITNLSDDIVCLDSCLTNHIIMIMGRAIKLKDALTYKIVHQWTREQNKFLYLKLNEKNELVGFAVLHEVDFDPLKKQKNRLF